VEIPPLGMNSHDMASKSIVSRPRLSYQHSQ
jgi:hypothetical protein